MNLHPSIIKGSKKALYTDRNYYYNFHAYDHPRAHHNQLLNIVHSICPSYITSKFQLIRSIKVTNTPITPTNYSYSVD